MSSSNTKTIILSFIFIIGLGSTASSNSTDDIIAKINSIENRIKVLEKATFNKTNYEYPDKKNRKKLIQNFIDVLIDNRIKPIITLKEQFDLMSVCFASDEALRLKRKIKIKYL